MLSPPPVSWLREESADKDTAVARSPQPPVSSLSKESSGEEQTQPGKIVLYVPQSAKVTINDKPTKSAGNRRVYLSHLAPGYTYNFRIELSDSGHLQQRDVVLEAGATQVLRFQQAEVAVAEKRTPREDSPGHSD